MHLTPTLSNGKPSSSISKIGWDGEVLAIQFQKGTIYAYKGVPIDVYLRFCGAPSKGEFFTFNIKSAGYEYVRCSSEAELAEVIEDHLPTQIGQGLLASLRDFKWMSLSPETAFF
jgi:hypothetical protein